MPDPLELAYRYLNRRDRTEGEVRRHLAGKGVEDGAVQDAIQMLREQGYVDDARYARLMRERTALRQQLFLVQQSIAALETS